MIRRSFQQARALLALALPIIVGQLAMVGMSITDTVMAGQASADDLAGLSISINLWVPISIWLLGLITAVMVIVAQYHGAADRQGVVETAQQGFWVALFCGVITAVLLYLNVHRIDALNAGPEISRISQGYLKAICWGLPAIAVDLALRSFCQGIGRVRVLMLINISAFLVNIALDYALVFGKWGLPVLGGVGCGWASMTIWWCMLACVVGYVTRSKACSSYAIFRRLKRPRWRPIRHILFIGLPMGLAMTAEEAFFSFTALLLADLGAVVVGSFQVFVSFIMLVVVISASLGQALAIQVGHTVGAGNGHALRFIAANGIVWSVAVVGLFGVVAAYNSEPLVAWFSDEPVIRQAAVGLMLISPMIVIMDAFSQVANGALRGLKDTRVPMLFQIGSYWLIGFPLAWLMVRSAFFGEPLGVTGCLWGMTAGVAGSALLLLMRLWKVSRPTGYKSAGAALFL